MGFYSRALRGCSLSHSIWAPLAAGLLLRVAWILLCPNEPSSDQVIYKNSAAYLARGEGYVENPGTPAGYWPVGYSAALAPAFWLFGAAKPIAFAMNVLYSLLLVVAGAKLGRAWFGERSGRFSAWLLAVHPTLVLYTTCIASENLFLPATLWFAYAVTLAAKSHGREAWLWATVAGVLVGLGAYVRATIAVLGVLVPLLFLLERRALTSAVGKTAWVGLCAALVLAPWALRNQARFGQLQPFSFNGAANLWMGNHPGSSGGYTELPPDAEPLPYPERERVLRERALAFIRGNPLEYAKLCVRRTLDTMKSDTIAVEWNRIGIQATLGERALAPLKLTTSALHWLLYAALAVRFSYGLRLAPIARGEISSLVSVVALAVPFVFIVSGNRYHTALLPFALLLAGHALAEAIWVRARSTLAPNWPGAREDEDLPSSSQKVA